MGGEWRCWFQLASPEELKERAARLKKVPKTKHGYHYPHEAFLGEYKESDDVILMLPHDKETEVKYVDPFGEEEGEKTLSVRHVMEKTGGLERYGESVESGVKDMVDFLEACGNPIPSKLTTVKFTQNQRITKVKCSDKKKVKLEYCKMTVLVKKEAHGRGTAGALEEKWITVAARGPPTLVKPLVEELTTNCKALAAESVKMTTAAEEEQEGEPSSSSAAAASSDFPTFIECGFAEFVSLMAARVKPPPIPMTKRAKTEGGADDVDGEKKSKKQKKKDAAAAGEAAMAGLAAGLAVVEGASAVVAAAAAAAAKGKGPVADEAKESDDDDDQDDEPILKMLPAKKKPGPKSKKEKEEMAAAAAAEAAANGGAALPAPAAAAETPKKERKKPGPKSKKEKEEIAAKAAAEAAAKAAAKAAAAEKEDSDSSGTDSDSDDDKPLAAML